MIDRQDEDWQRELRHCWPLLRPVQEEFAVFPLAAVRAAGRVLVGVDRNQDHHLLIPVPREEAVETDERSAYIKVKQTQLVVDSEARLYVDVVCQRHDLNSLFDDVLAAILTELGSSDDTASKICRRVLDRWRELLRMLASPLTEEVVRGLVGELTVLEHILGKDRDADIRSTWIGPDRRPHDFQLGGHDLEVKALAPDAVSVEIHGLDQLDAASRDLYLVLVFIRKSQDGFTLRDIVQRVRSLARDQRGLTDQLVKVGYTEQGTDDYPMTPYRVEQVCALGVESEFPRLTVRELAKPLPAAVTDIRYRLALAPLLPTARTDDALDEVFGRSGTS